MAKAMQVAQKGDLIAIRSGSYELQSEIPWEEERGRILPRVTLVGVDSDVTLTVTPFNHLSNHIHTALSNTTLRNLTVKTTGDELTLKSSSVINCTLTAPATVGLLRNSHAEQSVEGTKIQNCRVDGSVSVDGDGIVTDTTMAQLRMSGYKNTVKRCTIGKQGPPEVVVFTDTVAGSRILDSTIYGKIIEQSGPNRSDVYHLDEIKRCQFRASGGVNWFFKSVPAKKIWLNAFIGADISLPKGSVWDAGSGTSDPIRLYSKKHKLGNYYSAFKKNDENGDGVIDLPRPIPGKGDVVDQYPLANSDLSQYR
ncbi:hypothetical protein [Halobaculum sp. P14]|uniref:hypothetical protein n=1 Tax=Halobaculum sp. P14 TaxID=3421638 RepID=UPI003EBE7FED